jgi:hypothetical protein
MRTFLKILAAIFIISLSYMQGNSKSPAYHLYNDSLKTGNDDPVMVPTDSLEIIKLNLEKGEKLYTEKCGKCHVLYEPREYTQKQWKKNLKEMKEKAGLSKEQYSQILAYLSTNSKK